MKTLKVDQIVVDPTVQQRAAGIDQAYVAELSGFLADKKKELPAITVYAQNTMRGPYILGGGHHTLEAYKAAGRKVIPATVVKGTLQDAVIFALSDNATHGKRRTYEDCVKAVKTARGLFPDKPDLQIDKLCGLFPGFTSRLARKEGEREPDPVKSLAGKKGNEAKHGNNEDKYGKDEDKPEEPEEPEVAVYPDEPDDEVPFEVEEGPSADAPRDRLGRVLPESLQAAFLPGDLDTAYNAAKKAYSISRQQPSRGAEAGLRLGVTSLQRLLPYCVCPGCDGAGESCMVCNGAGYLTYGQYERLPEVLQEQARSFTPGDSWEGDLPTIPQEVPSYECDPGRDGKGQPIPRRLRDFFADSYLAEAATVIQGIGAGLQSATSWNPWLLSSTGERLQEMATEIAAARPYAVCQSCNGKGCAVCQTSGFFPISHQHEL